MSLPLDNSNEQLLNAFNKRDAHAFGIVYRMIYKELYLYANIWSREYVQFQSLDYIKTFCFIALKNAYKNKIKHLEFRQRFELESKVEHEFSNEMERIEAYNMLLDALQLLPDDYATVIRMYLEGWKPEEIASKLNLALQTVYNKRREAIVLLRKFWTK